MKNPITIHLLTKNNEKTIQRAIESLHPLNGTIIVGDVGSIDQTIRLASKCGAEVRKKSLNDDYGSVRNCLIYETKTKWQMYLEPWETLVGGHEKIISSIKEPSAFMLPCIQEDVFTKQIRLWHKDRNLIFSTPVYESITDTEAKHLYAPILVANHDRNHEMTLLIDKWKKHQPLAIEPYYYQACTLLSERKWKDFITIADYYLFKEKTSIMSLMMLRYYYAIVKCHIEKDYKEATRQIVTCLASKPLMSEFWCVLADIFYKQNDYDKAKVFYENAIVMGQRRLQNDDWPMEISKYRDYPTKMINACKNIYQNSKRYGVKK